ncbi:uncharacterized protein LOC122851751 [Aphidius gifuensis]|uniref:uncharacterized protein LOC122851751 n=1 Tax=Aphidius gifuensis TaxID=684658 RepID=UPI001CDBB38E|nr:uncharacterized protein LOC122851751 [Aphidius gifuensis]
MKIIIIFLFILSLLLKKGHGEKINSEKNSLLSLTKKNIDDIRNLTHFHHSLEESLQIKNQKELVIFHKLFDYALSLNEDLMTHPIVKNKNVTECKIRSNSLIVNAIVDLFDKISQNFSNISITFGNMCHQYLWSLDLKSKYPTCYEPLSVEIFQCLDNEIKNKHVNKLYKDLISNYYNSYESVNLSLDNIYSNAKVAWNKTIEKISRSFDLCVLSLPITLKSDSMNKADHSNYGKNLTNLYQSQRDVINTNNFRMFDQIKTIDWKISMNYLNHTFGEDKNVTCCINFSEEYLHNITTNALTENDQFSINQTAIFENFINAIIQRIDLSSTFNFCSIYKKNFTTLNMMFDCIDRSIVNHPSTKMINLYKELDNIMKGNRDLIVSIFKNDHSPKIFNVIKNALKYADTSFNLCIDDNKKLKKCVNHINSKHLN